MDVVVLVVVVVVVGGFEALIIRKNYKSFFNILRWILIDFAVPIYLLAAFILWLLVKYKNFEVSVQIT